MPPIIKDSAKMPVIPAKARIHRHDSGDIPKPEYRGRAARGVFNLD
ncbi:MAG: hypothetical protein ACR2P4_03065 [Gammaproteobacteria bacterium]